ncbi:MAG: hypothetical protein AB7S41_15820 [Parvibaculaceae bacterium]
MTARAFLSLLALTVVAVIGAIVVLVIEQSNVVVAARGGSLMFPELAEERAQVTQVSVDALRYDITVEKQGDRWVAIDRGGYPVRSEPVEQLLTAMAQVTEFEPRTDNEARYAEIDVAGPGEGITGEDMHFVAQTGDGDVVADAIVGAPSRSIGNRSGTFIRRTDEAQTWLVAGAVFFPNFMAEWFDPLFSIPGPEVGRVTIWRGQDMIFDAAKTSFETGDYELQFLAEEFQQPRIEAEDNAIRNLAQAIVSTTFEDAVPRDSITVPADARTIQFQTRGGLILAITLVPDGERTWVLYDVSAVQGSPAEAEAADIRARTFDWAFQLPPSRIITLSREVAQLVRVPPEPQPGLGPGQTPAPVGPLIPGLPR